MSATSFAMTATGETPEHVTFDVTAEQVARVKALAIRWDAARDVPAVDTEAPYGPGVDLPSEHREMQPVLQIFLRYADLGPGDFSRTASGWQPA